MNINAPFELTTISKTQPGDLIRVAHSASPLGLVVHRAEDADKRVIGVLGDNRGSAPYHLVFQRDFPCFRYNPSWVLHLDHRHALMAATDLWNTPGVVRLGASGVTMTFAPGETDWSGSTLTVNMGTFEWDEVTNTAAVFPEWAIWASEEDRSRDGAEPVFAFSLKSETA
jgi:hypothetical protein